MDGMVASRIAELIGELRSIEPVGDAELTPDVLRASGRLLHVDQEGGGIIGKAATLLDTMETRAGVGVPDQATVRALAELRGVDMTMWRDEYADPEKGRVITYRASDERVDDLGDVVRQDWDYSVFEGNPVMPLAHDWDGLPIGKHLDWRVMRSQHGEYDGPALMLLSFFAPEEVSARAAEAYRLVRAGFMPGGSTGFVSKAALNVKDPAERRRIGLGPKGLIFTKNRLKEFSPAMIPINCGAFAMLARAGAIGAVQPEDVQLWRELRRRSAVRAGVDADRDAWRDEDDRLVGMARVVWRSRTWEPATDVERPIVEAPAPKAKATARSLPASDPQREAPSVDQRLDAIERSVRANAETLDRVQDLLEAGLRYVQRGQDDAREALDQIVATVVRSSPTASDDGGDDGDDDALSVERSATVAGAGDDQGALVSDERLSSYVDGLERLGETAPAAAGKN